MNIDELSKLTPEAKYDIRKMLDLENVSEDELVSAFSDEAKEDIQEMLGIVHSNGGTESYMTQEAIETIKRLIEWEESSV